MMGWVFLSKIAFSFKFGWKTMKRKKIMPFLFLYFVYVLSTFVYKRMGPGTDDKLCAINKKIVFPQLQALATVSTQNTPHGQHTRSSLQKKNYTQYKTNKNMKQKSYQHTIQQTKCQQNSHNQSTKKRTKKNGCENFGLSAA